ncbi:MAG: primosomal protein N', partial [Gammaproteobacteria bacterium]|nr:primosomal protein N' [Gammaproteobacteria bacterium]
MSTPQQYLQIAVPTPLNRLFDYLPAKNMDITCLTTGTRVLVPFGRQRLVGIFIGLVNSSDVVHSKLKRILHVIDAETTLNADLTQLGQWAADYYHHPLGQVFAAMLPTKLRLDLPLQPKQPLCWRVTTAGTEAAQKMLARAPKQQAIFNAIQQTLAGMEEVELKQMFDGASAPLKELERKHFIESFTPKNNPSQAINKPATQALNEEQLTCVKQLNQSSAHFAVTLIDGITGSGKTEVYFHFMQKLINNGKQTLLLVPEIGLTPQLIQRIQSRFGCPVAILHSGLNDTERHRAWYQAKTGTAGIIIGTRSAIFTPMKNPGAIIIDEEHDLSYKQQEGFRYHARDLAVKRGKMLDIPVLLGSATASLETLYNVQEKRYQCVQLKQRAGHGKPPTPILIDVRNKTLNAGLSDTLIQNIKQHLNNQQQVLLFLNRRGYAPVLICHDCGWQANCHRCDSRLTYHQTSKKLHCHHCNHVEATPTQCGQCKSDQIYPLGQGTQRLEETLKKLFPQTPLIRIDRDSTRRKGSMQKKLDEISQHKAAILIGTQMLAKGHDYPNITLVALIDIDQGLYSSDIRATEHMAQTIVQVMGRAGRGKLKGEAMLQTHYPDHPLLQTLLHQGYAAFAKDTLEERRETDMPPFCSLVLLRAEAVNKGKALAFLEDAKGAIKAQNPSQIMLWGPVPAPMEKRGGRYRAQLLLHATDRKTLRLTLRQLLPVLAQFTSTRQVRWSVDVDPMSM